MDIFKLPTVKNPNGDAVVIGINDSKAVIIPLASIVSGTYVPFSSAQFDVDLNNKNLQNIAILSTVNLNSSNLANIGNATNVNQKMLRVGQGTSFTDIGERLTGMSGVWFTQASPSTTNFAIAGSATGQTVLNGAGTNGGIDIRSLGNNILILKGAVTSGANVSYNFTPLAKTNQSAESQAIRVDGGSTQYAVASLPIHREYHFRTNVVSATVPCVITDIFNGYFEANTLGANLSSSTSTSWALGTQGNVKIDGKLTVGNGTDWAITTNGNILVNNLLRLGTGIGNFGSNTLFGQAAARDMTSASLALTAIGNNAARGNTTGMDNTAVAMNSLIFNTVSDGNTGIGRSSLFSYTGTIGGNTGTGRNSGFSLIGGGLNTYLGQDAGNNALQKVDAVNSMALGNQAYNNLDNQVVIGNASVSEIGFFQGAHKLTTNSLILANGGVNNLTIQLNAHTTVYDTASGGDLITNQNQSIQMRFNNVTSVDITNQAIKPAQNTYFKLNPASYTKPTFSASQTTLLSAFTRNYAVGGTIATNYENEIRAVTYTAAAAGTITSNYSFYVNSGIASTNMTIPNNYAIGTNGGIQINAVAGRSQLNLPVTIAPTTNLVDGDIWREDNTITGLKIRIGGVTRTITIT